MDEKIKTYRDLNIWNAAFAGMTSGCFKLEVLYVG